MPTTKSRIQGALWGALVGDALGVPVEFTSRAERDAAPVFKMQGGGTHEQPAGTWSDDGSLLLCTAEGLIDGFSPSRLGDLYVRWWREGYWAAHGEIFDIGGTTRVALSRIADEVVALRAGGEGEDENGNGSLMRIAPVALRAAFRDPSIIAKEAMQASRITHAHRRSQFACAFYCLVLAGVVRGESLATAYAAAIDHLAPQVRQFPREEQPFSRLLRGEIPHLSRREVASTGYVIHTLEAALWCVFQHNNFSSAVLAAVNLGGDTDTTGCVAGALAGAVYGEESIPLEWPVTLARESEIAVLIERFTTACQAGPERSPALS